MNTRLLLAITSVAALASCSSSYKIQTPDDVYFSPAKPAAEYVKTETKEQPKTDPYKYDDYYSSEDRYLRWKVRDPQRWSTFDDYDYQWYNNPYNYGYFTPTISFGTYWNSYWGWNSTYNPYCHKVIVVNPKTNAVVYNKLRTYTPGTYNNTYNNNNRRTTVKVPTGGSYSPNKSSYNNSNNTSFGSTLKKIFSNSGTNYSNSGSSSSSSPVRTYSPSSSSSSSGSSGGSRSSGGGGGVSRPGRGG